MSELANVIRENFLFFVLGLLFLGVWYLEKISKHLGTIRWLVERELDRQEADRDRLSGRFDEP